MNFHSNSLVKILYLGPKSCWNRHRIVIRVKKGDRKYKNAHLTDMFTGAELLYDQTAIVCADGSSETWSSFIDKVASLAAECLK